MKQAFEGVKVLDLSDRISGAWAARLFGDFGAEVILSEPKEGHVTRHLKPKMKASNHQTSLVHQFVNWNKKSTIRDKETLLELTQDADIVITSQDLEFVKQLPLDSIHLSITPHGLNGPWSKIPGNDLTHCINSGWSQINKSENEEPLQLPIHQPSFIAGVAGFIAACAALTRGTRETVDVSELEATSLTCVPWLSLIHI